MASISKLVMVFGAGSADVTYSYNYANPEMTAAKVKALMTGLITNGSIFTTPPLTAKNAKLVTTTEGNYDLSD